jgi:hypothetical protein
MSNEQRAMSKQPRSKATHPSEEFDLLELLDRLETLLEDMDELGVHSRAETEARMAEIHAQLDAIDPESDAR